MLLPVNIEQFSLSFMIAKTMVIKSLIHTILVRIANSCGPMKEQSDFDLHYLTSCFCWVIGVQNLRAYAVSKCLCYESEFH